MILWYYNCILIKSMQFYDTIVKKKEVIFMQYLTTIQELETAVNEYGEIVISKNNNNVVIVMSMEE